MNRYRLSAGIICAVSLALVVPVVAVALVAPSLVAKKVVITAGTATQLVATGTPEPTSTVEFERFDGAAWVPVKSRVASEGVALLSVKPLVTTAYRATVASGTEAVSSEVVTVTVKAKLSAIRLERRTVRKKAEFIVKGTIYPRHALGSEAVTLKWSKYDAATRKWVLDEARTKTAPIVSSKGTKSTWSARFVFSPPLEKGRWRVRASHVDTDHAQSYSPNRAYVRITK